MLSKTFLLTLATCALLADSGLLLFSATTIRPEVALTAAPSLLPTEDSPASGRFIRFENVPPPYLERDQEPLADLPRIRTPRSEILENRLWGGLYGRGGATFFCEQRFTTRNLMVTEDYIYPARLMREYLGCSSEQECQARRPEYRMMTSDLHNIVVVSSDLALKRGFLPFGEVAEADTTQSFCNANVGKQFIQPPPSRRGDVARIILYMQQTYGLPPALDAATLANWEAGDPADESEQSRDRSIAALQGNANPFIPSTLNTDYIASGE